MSDGANWRMQQVGAKGLVQPPSVPSDAPATFWTVQGRAR
jgi:hypothetical protein